MNWLHTYACSRARPALLLLSDSAEEGPEAKEAHHGEEDGASGYEETKEEEVRVFLGGDEHEAHEPGGDAVVDDGGREPHAGEGEADPAAALELEQQRRAGPAALHHSMTLWRATAQAVSEGVRRRCVPDGGAGRTNNTSQSADH